MHHPDPFAGDSLLYRVDRNNLKEHENQLPEGMKALLERYPDYHLRVFPTRRSAAVPQRIYDATRFNAVSAELIANGNGIQGAAAGIPSRSRRAASRSSGTTSCITRVTRAT